jgi:hypothetical protein
MNDFALPETRYALSGDVNIAYQTMGAGPVDIIMVPGFISHVEFMHEMAGYTAFCVVFRHLPASSLLTNEARDYPIEYQARRRSSSAWMTFAQLWMTSVHRGR